MAITFAIEPGALTEHLGEDSRDLVSFHKRIIRVWAQYGILIDPGKGPSSIVQMFMQEALMPVRKIWELYGNLDNHAKIGYPYRS